MHPLEPLSAAEVQKSVAILKENGKLTPTTRIVSISLKEPPKERVHQGKSADTLPREARCVLFDNGTNTCHHGAISLATGKLLAWKELPGKQPTMTIDEQVE